MTIINPASAFPVGSRVVRSSGSSASAGTVSGNEGWNAVHVRWDNGDVQCCKAVALRMVGSDAPAMVPQQVQQQQGRDMRAGPDVMRATAQAFQDADEAWGEALRREFGRRAAEARYSPAGKGDVGSPLRALYCARYAAYSAWCEARCMPVMPDPACSAVTVKPSCDRVSA